ncbi:S-layer homology domain-containing protein [Salibacterium sp. K-3]
MRTGYRAGLLLSAAVAAVIGSGHAAAADSFSDVSGSHWASDSIQRLTEEGIVNGYDDGTYHPGEEIKRGQVAELLTTAFSLEVEDNASSSFSDLNNGSYYTPFAEAVDDAGYMTGNGDVFAAGDDLTRQQMATILVRAFDFEAVEDDTTVQDLDKASATHRGNIEVLAQHGITQTDNGMFRPDETVTRDQFAVFLDRAKAAAHSRNSGIIEVSAYDSNTVDVSFNRQLSAISVDDFSFEPSVGVLSVEFVDPDDSLSGNSGAETVVRLTTGDHENGGHHLYYKGERTDNEF